MSLKPDTQRLLDAAERHEELPSRERMARVRSAVLRRAALGGASAAAVASSTTLWAKAAALGASAAGQVATYAVVGALAGSAVMLAVPPPQPATTAAASTRSEAVVSVRASSPSAETLPEASKSRDPVLPPRSAPVASALPSGSTTAENTLPSAEMGAAHDDTVLAADPVLHEARRGAPPPTSPRLVVTPLTAAPPREPAAMPTAGQVETPEGPPLLDTRARDALRPQLDILHEMRGDLAAQRGAHALSLYLANESLFRGGALEPEARAALIAALCQQGRDEDASRESAALRQTFPNSHLARSLGAGCRDADRSGRAR
jgi:hypothetical protein